MCVNKKAEPVWKEICADAWDTTGSCRNKQKYLSAFRNSSQREHSHYLGCVWASSLTQTKWSMLQACIMIKFHTILIPGLAVLCVLFSRVLTKKTNSSREGTVHCIRVLVRCVEGDLGGVQPIGVLVSPLRNPALAFTHWKHCAEKGLQTERCMLGHLRCCLLSSVPGWKLSGNTLAQILL